MPWQGQLAFHPPAAVLGAVDSILALLATLTNQNKDARLHVERSLQLLSKNEAWPLLARAQFEGAQALAPFDAGAAAALLHESEALAQQLNMSALLNAIATQKQAGNQGYPDGLTERETEVLALLSLGRSNKDITKVLGISLSTTATHVRNILSKTGCANRTEAAAYALQHKILSPMD